MKNLKSYFPFAIVAVIAALVGWGVSAFGLNQKSNVVAQPEAAQISNDLAPATIQPAQLIGDPAQFTAPVESPVTVAQPVAAKATPRAQAARPRIARNDDEASRSVEPTVEKKPGMSNKTKTAIVIGGGAATGAIIGGMTGGGKGAAIGAAIGGGSGAVYSIIRNKQGKPVW